MIRFASILVALTAAVAGGSLQAQMPVPHELLVHKRSTFKVPRTRPWDDRTWKYFGGGPDVENECGGAGHCFHRPAVWTCPHYFVPPYRGTWIIRGEGLGLSREEEDQQFILFRTTDDQGLFALSDFDFDQQLAYRASAQRNFGDYLGIEAVYLRLQDEWAELETVDDADPIELRAAGIVINSPTDPFDVLYATRFQSGEVNLRYALKNYSASLIAGFRWVEVDEVFSAGVEAAPPELLVETKNRLLGAQFGMETQHWVNYGILRIDAAIKGGIYQNASHQISRLDPERDNTRATDIAWVGESEVAANFPITRHTYLRASYRLIHVAGLAVAADQINGTDLSVPDAVLYNDGNAIYHGWSVGLEAWW